MQTGMKNPNAALAGSYDFMHLMGHVCLGLMWTRMAKAAYVALDAGRRGPRLSTRPRSRRGASTWPASCPPAPCTLRISGAEP
jgi:hypothetical protein